MLKIAVLTDHKKIFDSVSQCFGGEGHQCTHFAGELALSRAIYRDDFDVVFVDASGDPGRLSAVSRRQACFGHRRAPLIVLGEFSDRESLQHAFDAGADEVLVLPLHVPELSVRTDVALRRAQSLPTHPAGSTLALGAYQLERHSGTVKVDGRVVRLTGREFAMAWLLFSRAGEYVSRRELAGVVWGSAEDIAGRTLEQHIYKLRRKLELGGPHGVLLRTIYAHGYRIEITGEHSAPAHAAPPTWTAAQYVEPFAAATPAHQALPCTWCGHGGCPGHPPEELAATPAPPPAFPA